MFRGWFLLLHGFLLVLCPGNSSCAIGSPPDGSQAQIDHFEKRYDGLDYDSFIGLMGKRSAGPNSPLRRNMNDVFVGLLGRRNTMSALPAWRVERKDNIFLKDRRLRFCCGSTV